MDGGEAWTMVVREDVGEMGVDGKGEELRGVRTMLT